MCVCVCVCVCVYVYVCVCVLACVRITKTEIDYILTNKPDIVTDITVIKQVNIGSDHRVAMSNIKLDVEVERKKMMAKRPPRIDDTQIG